MFRKQPLTKQIKSSDYSAKFMQLPSLHFHFPVLTLFMEDPLLWRSIGLTHDVLVDGPAEAVLDLQLGVDAVRLQLAPLVDVAVGRREGDGEQAHDEQVPQEPEIGRHLKMRNKVLFTPLLQGSAKGRD